jgi:hypothetical protein
MEELNEEVKSKKANTKEDHEALMRALELEAKQLELLDLRDRTNDRKNKREDKLQKSRANGQTLEILKENNKANQDRCNHRKGGNGVEGIIFGRGDDPQFAVLKHQFHTGDIWVRCLRCRKTWKPPVKDQFFFNAKGRVVAPQDGKFSQEAFDRAEKEYKEALIFPTRNTMSTSHQFQWSDGGVYARRKMMDTDLS